MSDRDRVPSLTSLPAPLRAVLDKAAKAVVVDGIRYDYSIVGSELGKNLHKYLHDEAWPAWWEVWGQVGSAETFHGMTNATQALLTFCQDEFPALMAEIPPDKLLTPADGFVIGLVHAVETEMMLQAVAQQQEKDGDASPAQRLARACDTAVEHCEDAARWLARLVHNTPPEARDDEMRASFDRFRERTLVRGSTLIAGVVECFPELSTDPQNARATLHQVVLALLDRHLGFIYGAARQALEQHEITQN